MSPKDETDDEEDRQLFADRVLSVSDAGGRASSDG
jgi:hypothetical protein